jgi:hypothetical protein
MWSATIAAARLLPSSTYCANARSRASIATSSLPVHQAAFASSSSHGGGSGSVASASLRIPKASRQACRSIASRAASKLRVLASIS